MLRTALWLRDVAYMVSVGSMSSFSPYSFSAHSASFAQACLVVYGKRAGRNVFVRACNDGGEYGGGVVFPVADGERSTELANYFEGIAQFATEYDGYVVVGTYGGNNYSFKSKLLDIRDTFSLCQFMFKTPYYPREATCRAARDNVTLSAEDLYDAYVDMFTKPESGIDILGRLGSNTL